MSKQSAGILVYKVVNQSPLVFLVHPGGPFYSKKDLGAWSIPKGEFEDGENPLSVAKREFTEETGIEINGDFLELSPVKLKSGKKIFAWACSGDINATSIKSNTFELEWPPKSGKKQAFPEVDKAEWFSIKEGQKKINDGQKPLLEELAKLLGHQIEEDGDDGDPQLSLF